MRIHEIGRLCSCPKVQIAITLLVIICLPLILCSPIFIASYISNQAKKFTSKKSEVERQRIREGRQKISNSLTGYILWRILYILMLLTMLASTYNESKFISIIIFFGLIVIIKDNYKIYLDLTLKDGLNINGTIVKAIAQSSYNAAGEKYQFENFEYLLEIETDDGNNIKCASKFVALLQGDRIENAYITKRTKILKYCYKPQISSNELEFLDANDSRK